MTQLSAEQMGVTIKKGTAVGKSEIIIETTAQSVAKQASPAVGVPDGGVSPAEVVLMANDWESRTIDQRFRFTWALICKLAVKAVCLNKSLDEMCEWALRQQLAEMKNG